MKINEENWLTATLRNLEEYKMLTECATSARIVSDENSKEKIEELEAIIKYLNKTN